ncbi:MAG: hypothetical protein EXQ59_05320 [Acidobacteria bacterium]|nr:hypothetical protein [Acidobacteriota bacterium]
MSHASIGCLAATGALVALITVPVTGQSRFITPWGDPDLQGLWSTQDRTPFQNADPVIEAAIDEAEKTRYGAEGRGEGFGGGMSSIDFTPRSPRRLGFRVVDPVDGRVPIKPEEVQYQIDRRGVSRAMGDHWKNHIPLVRCLSEGFTLSGVYRLLQSPGYVVISSERIHDVRIIPVDGRSHVNPTIRQWNGDSRGRWEGQTLVVETTNFSDGGEENGGGRQTAGLRVVERFTRAGATTVQYEATFEDPSVFTRPWTYKQPHIAAPKYQMYEYACHEGNRRYMEGALRQGRLRDAEDAAAAAKAKKTN